MRAFYRLLAANRDYRLLLTAGLVSMTGDYVLRIGLTYLVYVLTGSTLASGGILLASFLPQILLGSWAGVLVDRWDRRTTMVVANLLQVVGLLPLFAVHGSGSIWVVYAVGAWQGCVEQFFAPAEQALIPHLVPADDLLGANGANSQVGNLARLVGSAAGGVIATLFGISGLATFDAVSFAVAAGLLLRIRFRPDPHTRPTTPDTPATAEATADTPGTPGSLTRVLREWRAGLATCLASPALRVIVAWGAIAGVGEGVMGTLFAPFVRDVLHGTGSQYGLIVGIQAVGGIIGGISVTSAGHRWSAYALFGWGSVAFGLIDLALFLYPLVWSGIGPAVVLMTVVGIPGAFTMAGLMTTFQTETSDEFRGRVYGAFGAVFGAAILVGIGLAGWLGEVVGIVRIISIQGFAGVLGGVVVLVALRHSRATTAHVPSTPSDAGFEAPVLTMPE